MQTLECWSIFADCFLFFSKVLVIVPEAEPFGAFIIDGNGVGPANSSQVRVYSRDNIRVEILVH